MMTEMIAQIIQVVPNYIEGPASYDQPGHVPSKIVGTWDVELVMVAAPGLTFEQACDYMKEKTKFKLVPVEE